MPTRLVQEEFIIGEFRGVVTCELDLDQAAGWVELISYFKCDSPEGRDEFSISHKSVVSNPIAMTVSISAIATKFASCFALNFSAAAAGEIYQAYRETTDNLQARENKCSLQERVQIFGNKIKGKERNLKSAALGAVINCVGSALTE